MDVKAKNAKKFLRGRWKPIVACIGVVAILSGTFVCLFATGTFDNDASSGVPMAATGSVSYSSDKETGSTYANNMVLVFFDEAASANDIEEVVSSINGSVLSNVEGTSVYQIEIPKSSLKDIEQLCEELSTNEHVYKAECVTNQDTQDALSVEYQFSDLLQDDLEDDLEDEWQ